VLLLGQPFLRFIRVLNTSEPEYGLRHAAPRRSGCYMLSAEDCALSSNSAEYKDVG